MPLPKRRHSATRGRKRRTHDHLKTPLLVSCPVSKILHKPHVAYWVKDALYYKGVKVFEEKNTAADAEAES